MKKWQLPQMKNINIRCTKEPLPGQACDNGPNGDLCYLTKINWSVCYYGITESGQDSNECMDYNGKLKCKLGNTIKTS